MFELEDNYNVQRIISNGDPNEEGIDVRIGGQL